MISFQVQQHVHDLINRSRTKFGRHELSNAVDEALAFVEKLQNRSLRVPMDCLIAEQQYLLPGFRLTVMRPGRVGGKVGPICSRNYFGNLLESVGAGHSLTEIISWMSSDGWFPDISALQWAEIAAFVEIFPECIDHSLAEENDERRSKNYDWWADRRNFEPRLSELGLEIWTESEGDKKAFYRGF